MFRSTFLSPFVLSSFICLSAALDTADHNPQSISSGYRNPTRRYELGQGRPNILFLLVDELRYPVVYETPDLRQWSDENLTTMKFLRDNGVNFDNHYCGATACVPSRATLFTGQYPTLHGVSQTDGAAKPPMDPSMFWLSPYAVPTAGNIFEEGGYSTYYIGKWHFAKVDLYGPGTQTPVFSYNTITGVPDAHLMNVYQTANMLAPFGFGNGWIGPDPHGSDPHQSGSSAAIGVSGRDEFYANQTVALLNQLNNQAGNEPWIIVCSFVNPHDITLYGNITRNYPTFNFVIDPTLPNIPPSPTANEDLSTKPVAQQSYQTQYQLGFQSTTDTLEFRQFYYSLQKQVDTQMGVVLDALMQTRFKNNTIVVFTADHGDLLGSHGNFQKWFNIYEESIHVPMVFYSPTLLPKGTHTTLLTSHLDLVPTLCGFANIDYNAVTQSLQTTYTNSRLLVGRNLSGVVYGTATQSQIDALAGPILFITYDQILTGAYSENAVGTPFDYVSQPSFIHAIITELNGQIWKLGQYFANPDWVNGPVSCSCSDPIVTAATEYEMYNLTLDPLETQNLANPQYSTPFTQIIQAQLTLMLQTEVNQKLLYPTDRIPYFPLLPPPS